MNDRDVLKKALLPPKSLKYAVAMKLDSGAATQNVYKLKLEKERLKELKREEEERTLAPYVMVPWVHWPGHSETGQIQHNF